MRIKLRRVGHKLVRLDPAINAGPGGDPKADAVGGGESLIGLLLKAIRSHQDPADRRQDSRHPALAQEVWVGWWTGDDFGAVSGRVVNISRGGAQVDVDCRPPRKTSVWLYKDLGSTLASVRGEVVGLTPAPGGGYTVRFRFAAPCPTVFCESVICRQSRTERGRVQT